MATNRLPRRVPLSPTVTILVMRASPQVLAGIIEEGTGGAWDWKNKTIWIDKTMPLPVQWKALRHELQHALVDVHEEENGGLLGGPAASPSYVPPEQPDERCVPDMREAVADGILREGPLAKTDLPVPDRRVSSDVPPERSAT